MKDGERDRDRESALLEALAEVLSNEENQRVLASALLELDHAGRKRLLERVGDDTAAALQQVLEPDQRTTRPQRPGRDKVRQEWDRAWSEWHECVSESSYEEGRYVMQDAHWEPPYLDSGSLADDLELIAAQMKELLPRVMDEDIDPGFSFPEALKGTVEEIGSGLPEWLDDPEGYSLGPEVTRCLLEWEWLAGQRRGQGPFEVVENICRMEDTLDTSLDGQGIIDFVFELNDSEQQAVLRGITANQQVEPWARVLRGPYGGWFALYQGLTSQWDVDSFLASCRANITRDWQQALPPAQELLRRGEPEEAHALILEALVSLMRLTPGESWDPLQDLFIQHPSQRYWMGDRDTRRELLEIWREVAAGMGQEDVACALQLQAKILEQWQDLDAVLAAFRQAEASSCAPACDRLFEQWRERISEAVNGTAQSWVHGLVDAARADDVQLFHRAVLTWLGIIENAEDLKLSLRPLDVLTVATDPGSRLKRTAPLLWQRVSHLVGPADELRMSIIHWTRRLKGSDLFPEILDFWKRNVVRLVPEPARAHKSDYTSCAQWLAVVNDLDRQAYARTLKDWSTRHRRRRNLWKALKEMRLPLDTPT